MLALLAGAVVGEARMPKVGDHVTIDYSDTVMNTIRYNATITNISGEFYCIKASQIFIDGWHDITAPNDEACLGIPYIKLIAWN
jgi:hypothetical protein